jgi:hypothetical protein
MSSQITPLYPVSGTDTAKVQGIPVSTTDPTGGQILVYNSATLQYEPSSEIVGTSLGSISTQITGQQISAFSNFQLGINSTLIYGASVNGVTLTCPNTSGTIALTSQIGTVAVGGITGLGTGVATALAISVGSAGSVALTNGTTSPTALSAAGNTALTVSATSMFSAFLVTAGAGAGGYTATVSLNTSAAVPQAGATAIVKIDLAASNNPRVQLRSNTTVIGEAIGNGTARTVVFRCIFDGSAWSVVSRVPSAEVFTITRTQAPAGATGSTGSWTWTLPVGSRYIETWLVSAGAGGGSGRRGSAGSARSGGGGGGAGNVSIYTCSSISLPSQSLVFTLAAGGAGGAAVAVDDTNGNAGGGTGGANIVSGALTLLYIPGGATGGGAGTNTTVSGGGSSGNTLRLYQGTSGGGSNATGAPSASGSASFPVPTGGAGGGGISTGNTAYAGAQSGFTMLATSAGPLGGSATGGNGIDASAFAGADQTAVGVGASGGGGNSAGAGGNGGNGQFGSGGGGGGASVNGFASGAGGNGGDAVSRITVFF